MLFTHNTHFITCGAGTAHSSGAPEFIRDFQWGLCYSISSLITNKPLRSILYRMNMCEIRHKIQQIFYKLDNWQHSKLKHQFGEWDIFLQVIWVLKELIVSSISYMSLVSKGAACIVNLLYISCVLKELIVSSIGYMYLCSKGADCIFIQLYVSGI